MSNNAMMETALGYAQRGLKVIPLHSFVGSECSCNNGNCESPSKHPRIKQWKGAATSNPATIHQWWTMWPEANIGIVFGKKFRLMAIEIVGEHGAENFRRLCAEHNYVCATLAAVRASGRQLYYHHPGWGIPKGVRTFAPVDTSSLLPQWIRAALLPPGRAMVRKLRSCRTGCSTSFASPRPPPGQPARLRRLQR